MQLINYVKNNTNQNQITKALFLSTAFIAAIFICTLSYLNLANDHILDNISQRLNTHYVQIKPRPKERTPILIGDKRLNNINEDHAKHEETIIHDENSIALTPAPIQSVTEKTLKGNLPKVSDNGLTPFDAYKKLIKLPNKNTPVIALALLDFGRSQKLSTQLLENIDNNITLLTSPYTNNLQKLIDNSRKKGFETWLNVPFETLKYPQIDTGPETILVRSSITLNIQRLIWALSTSNGYAGIYGYIDNTFEHAEILVRSIVNYLFARGLGYFEINEHTNDTPNRISAKHKTPYLEKDIHITTQNAEINITRLINKSIQNKAAIGILELSPKTIEKLPYWINEIQSHGIQLVPLSAIDDYMWTNISNKK